MKWRTWLLMGALSALLVAFGYLLGGQSGALFALVVSAAMNLAGYWFSDRLVLSMSGARPVSEAEAPELYAITRRLCQRAGLPMPRLYMIPAAQPNAFATGRDPQHAAVAVTAGLLEMMDRSELEGVIAHELAHIKNRDILVASVAAALAGAITMLADMAQWALVFGGGRHDDEEGGAGSMLGALLMMFLAPLAAMLIQLAISRSREYLADATAARIVGHPHGLIRALEKLAYATQAMPMRVNPAVSHMYIAQPLSGEGLLHLFSTHPPISERIRRLRAMA
ncbi:MAG TPA: zinc metalloprotease HtpX [Thermaerobacter sp.]|nr:MAG: protease HtpX [Bacillota bacterium]